MKLLFASHKSKFQAGVLSFYKIISFNSITPSSFARGRPQDKSAIRNYTLFALTGYKDSGSTNVEIIVTRVINNAELASRVTQREIGQQEYPTDANKITYNRPGLHEMVWC